MDVSVKIIKLAATSTAIVLCLLAPLFLPVAPQVLASSSIVSPTTSSIPAAITSSGKIHTTVPVRINVQLNAGDTLQGSIVITYGDMIGGAEFYIEDVSGTTVCNFGRVKDSRNFQCIAKTTGLHTIVIKNPSITYAAYYELTYDIIPGSSTTALQPGLTSGTTTSSGKISTVVPVRINVQLNAGDTLQGSIVITYGDMIGGAEFYIENVSGTTVCNFGRVKDSRNFQCIAQTTGLHTIVIKNPSITYAAYYELTYEVIPGQSITPFVSPPYITSFTANPSGISPGGGSILSWSVSGATSVSIDHGVGSVPASGSVSVQPSTTITYTLTATNSGGPASRSVVITVTGPAPDQQPTIISFSADPGSITQGQTSILTWSVSNATMVTIDQGIGNVALNGTRVVSPFITTLYTLTATNASASVPANTQIIVEETIWGKILSLFRNIFSRD